MVTDWGTFHTMVTDWGTFHTLVTDWGTFHTMVALASSKMAFDVHSVALTPLKAYTGRHYIRKNLTFYDNGTNHQTKGCI